jgi:3-hydroxybutyryl-CoA dehydrogenase
MGSGIAEVAVRAGVGVTVFETTDALITAGRNRIVKSLERGVSAGKVTERERDRALGKLTFTTDLNDLADRQLVIEAIVEDEAIKAEIFCELGRVVTDPNAVLASNTSSIPIMKIAAATKNPQRALGLHFFNPVPVCCRWSSWSAHWSPTKPRPLAPRSLLVQFWANRWCAARTVPALW